MEVRGRVARAVVEWGWVSVEVAEVVDCGCYWMIAGGGNGAGCRIRMVHGGEWCGVGFGGGGSGSRVRSIDGEE